MVKTTLKIGSGINSLNKLTLIFKDESNITTLIQFKDLDSALNLYQELSLEYFGTHGEDTTVEINGYQYTWIFSVWQDVLSCLDQWFTEYAHENTV